MSRVPAGSATGAGARGAEPGREPRVDPVEAPPDRRTRARARTLVVAALVVVAVVVAALLVALLRRGGPDPAVVPAPAPPSAAPTAAAPTSAANLPPATGPGVTTPAAGTPADAISAVWPPAAGSLRYPTPEAAVTGFATGLAGFVDPVLGPYRAGDARSGEIEVRPAADGPASTVFVRRLGDGTWWVLGSATTDVTLTSPAAGDVVTSPLALTGSALAFEGHVTVRLFADGGPTPLATTFVTGGGDVARPFAGTVAFGAPAAGAGSLVLTTEAASDGSVWTASVVRVRF